ncbi:MAG: PD-(D/E)XK nuclease family protein [Armatimonadota bacterium]|nr:PD-(D/E)XK nuclease family protein [Armatimonadota bacterium]
MHRWIFSATGESELACPYRYVRTHLQEEYILAPFAASWFGQKVHERISRSLRYGLPIDERPFWLPPKLVLQEGEDLQELIRRANAGLQRFEREIRPSLLGKSLSIEERFVWDFWLEGRPVRLVGKMDVVVTGAEVDEILDWKTGDVAGSQDQLRYYLVLYHRSTGKVAQRARAIGLETGDTLEESWDEELEEWAMTRVATMVELKLRTLEKPDQREPGPQCRFCPFASTCPASVAPSRYLVDTRTGQISPLRDEVEWEELSSRPDSLGVETPDDF